MRLATKYFSRVLIILFLAAVMLLAAAFFTLTCLGGGVCQMIPNIDRKKHPCEVRMANRAVQVIVAKAKRIMRRRARKGYGFKSMQLIKRELL